MLSVILILYGERLNLVQRRGPEWEAQRLWRDSAEKRSEIDPCSCIGWWDLEKKDLSSNHEPQITCFRVTLSDSCLVEGLQTISRSKEQCWNDSEALSDWHTRGFMEIRAGYKGAWLFQFVFTLICNLYDVRSICTWARNLWNKENRPWIVKERIQSKNLDFELH